MDLRAGICTGRVCHKRGSRPAAIRLFALACCVLLPVLFYLPSGFANTYKRGYTRCNDFQDVAGFYKTSPTESNYAVAYAGCLLARNAGDDVRALLMLEAEASRGNVGAAYWLALYTATGGTMNIAVDWESENYNEALLAFGRVIHLINQIANYPKGELNPEYFHHYELKSYHYLVFFSYLKFLKGLDGSDNLHLLQSPTYTGDRNLNLYPKYSSYTLHSLEQIIENAKICAALPEKRHFKNLMYKKITLHCRKTIDYVQKILYLERERLALLNNPACARDIEACSDYQEVLYGKMVPLLDEAAEETNKVWDMTDADF